MQLVLSKGVSTPGLEEQLRVSTAVYEGGYAFIRMAFWLSGIDTVKIRR